MKLELSFSCVTDLTNQLQDLLEDLKGNDVQRAAVIHVGGTVVSAQPSIVTDEVATPEPFVEVPKKRTRRTKEELMAQAALVNAPKVQALVVEQPALPEVVETAPVIETPKNFYSMSEFSVNFAIVLNTLLNDGSLNIGDLETACKYYDVKNIYLISKDIAMMEHFYNDLVSRQIITKKGDY